MLSKPLITSQPDHARSFLTGFSASGVASNSFVFLTYKTQHVISHLKLMSKFYFLEHNALAPWQAFQVRDNLLPVHISSPSSKMEQIAFD